MPSTATTSGMSIDGSEKESEFKNYEFIKAAQKTSVKKVSGAKRTAIAAKLPEVVKAVAKKDVKVKKQTTMDLKKGKVSTIVVKQVAAKGKKAV